MGTGTLERQYSKLTPPERFTLAVSAMSRDDDVELSRLRDTCPRRVYRLSDTHYTDRMEQSFHVAAAVMLDLRRVLGRLSMLAELSDVLGDGAADVTNDVAGELVTLWTGFGRFTDEHLNLDPMVLLNAWRYPTDELAETLARFPDVLPDEQGATDYASTLAAGWAERIA